MHCFPIQYVTDFKLHITQDNSENRRYFFFLIMEDSI